MKLIFFFEDDGVARSVARSWCGVGVDIVPASSSDEVERTLDAHHVEAVLTPARSASTWLTIEEGFPSKVTMPRILVVSSPERAPQWSNRIAFESGFDGFMAVDRSAPPHSVVHLISKVVREATTAGARRPELIHDLAVSPTIERITGDDDLNLQILGLLSFGRTYEEIAASVSLAPQTVRNRVSQMLKRSGTRNRAELSITYQQLVSRAMLTADRPSPATDS